MSANRSVLILLFQLFVLSAEILAPRRSNHRSQKEDRRREIKDPLSGELK